jgi:hypothetical protein
VVPISQEDAHICMRSISIQPLNLHIHNFKINILLYYHIINNSLTEDV